jgi:glycine cleavage system H protein
VSATRYPEELLYHPEHDWARIGDDGVAEFGVTWFAQDSLGDVVFFDPKDVGSTFAAGESYGELESVKTVSDLVAPMGGEIVEVNQEVVDEPERVNTDPYANWLVRVKLSDPAEKDSLLSAAAYADLV